MLNRLLFSSVIAILLSACGDNESKQEAPQQNKALNVDSGAEFMSVPNSELKVDSTAEFTAEQKQELKSLGHRNLKDLKPEEKAKVVNILWHQLVNSKLLTLAKQLCHISSLEGDRPCQEVRDSCLGKLSKYTEESYKKGLEQEQADIVFVFNETINQTQVPAQNLEIVFEYYDAAISVLSVLDCKATKEQIGRVATEHRKAFIKKYGEDTIQKLDQVFQKYLLPAAMLVQL